MCPFCGATSSAEIGPRRVLAGRVSRSALFAAGAVGVGIATTDCAPTAVAEYGGVSAPSGIEDSGASDSPGEAVADAADAADATDTSATAEPTDSASAADVPVSTEPPYGSPVIGQPVYGAALIPDE